MVVPLPGARDAPAVLPSPFAVPPHPLAQRAAEALVADVRAGRLGVNATALDAVGEGKMFGVLVVRAPDGALGYLRAFSGMLEGTWTLPGFVPPLFDQAARDAMWPAGQATLREHEVALRSLLADPAYTSAQAHLRSWREEHARDLAALQAKHRERRAARKAARQNLGEPTGYYTLEQQSREDASERKRFDAERAAELARLEATLAAFDVRRASLEDARAAESRGLMRQVLDQYVIANAHGETRTLHELFHPQAPPGGAGDCAAPKLLGEAYRCDLVPLAFAEVWIGGAPWTGGRSDGAFYPACRGKCGPLLPFMLQGLAHEPVPEYGTRAPASEPRVVFEDEWLVVVDKPEGMLSVPGRSGALRDCAESRLRGRAPTPDGGPHLVHRLDLDTSGLLVAAKTNAVRAMLQAMFARREIEKEYVALVTGEIHADVHGDHGTISLPLRVDLDDRPRQIVDDEHGKEAVTAWRVLAREAGRTRVALSPQTGRTHQLRVHCAHPQGLAAPIEGDRLYGAPAAHTAPRMMLHAERIAFTHPVTGERVMLVTPAPF